MDDVESVTAFWLSDKTLQVECPYCNRIHYHVARGSPYHDIREANCRQKHLPKKLRGKRLIYRLYHNPAPGEGPCRIIPFPKQVVAAGDERLS